ncbi:hypothetical protein EDB86DRAFT_2894346 [Lactarius hatsudake]|nr:hypothetical protein EDB86DRAFT_2894346 [Lactarius hatsudake]
MSLMNGYDTFDDLFLERLDAFTEKTLADIKAFSSRENIPYDQVRRHVAERHSQYLFSSSIPAPDSRNNSAFWSPHYVESYLGWLVAVKVHNILSSTCQVLESLQVTAGIQSFVVAINPNDAEDEGFLGGSLLGKEFWTSLRGGGTAGAKALKSLAISTFQDPSLPPTPTFHGTGIPSRQKETAHSLKSEVYARVRTLLRRVCDNFHPLRWLMACHHDRATSGIRQAEMKWTNHGNLSVYGVRLEGWPSSIPMQNPSTLSSSQNRALRDALSNGTLKFCRIHTESSTSSVAGETFYGPTGNLGDLSWVISDGYDDPVRSLPLLRLGF